MPIQPFHQIHRDIISELFVACLKNFGVLCIGLYRLYIDTPWKKVKPAKNDSKIFQVPRQHCKLQCQLKTLCDN